MNLPTDNLKPSVAKSIDFMVEKVYTTLKLIMYYELCAS